MLGRGHAAPVNICCHLRARADYQIIDDVIIVHAILMAVGQHTTHPLLHLLAVLV